jgi:geranylgeranyl transferase type-1 subunit beta
MERPKFDKDRHIGYWQRCLKSLLPNDYTSTDSSRVLLGFFILSALDILGVGVDTLPPSDVKQFRSWILSCEHPNGGFCGSPNHKYPKRYYDVTRTYDVDPDPANLPATYFAILSLSFVGGFRDVKRIDCLRWLKRLQREDGSFGEVLGEDGNVEGGRDMRYCHFASGVRWMLRGDLGSNGGEIYEDIDVDKLVKHIQAGEVTSLCKVFGHRH